MFEVEIIFAFALFSIGLYGVSTQRDFLRLFFSLEILINAVILILASSAYHLNLPHNLPLAYMIIIIATLEAGVGILIFALSYKYSLEVIPDNIKEEV